MQALNHLQEEQKERLIKLLKESDDNYIREKALILLLINDGKTYQEISEFLEIAYTTVAYTKSGLATPVMMGRRLTGGECGNKKHL